MLLCLISIFTWTTFSLIRTLICNLQGKHNWLKSKCMVMGSNQSKSCILIVLCHKSHHRVTFILAKVTTYGLGAHMLDSWWSFCLPRRSPLSRWPILYCLLSSIRNSLPGLFMILKLSLPSEYIQYLKLWYYNITASQWIWICKIGCASFFCENVFNFTPANQNLFFLLFCIV